MRRLFLFLSVCCVLAFLALPALIVALYGDGVGSPPSPIEVSVSMPNGRARVMDLEAYVRGVVCAEMPSSFHQEALAAQAVAARTYAVQRLLHSPSAPLSASPSVHQAWEGTAEAFRGLSALQAFCYRRKIERALRETTGQVLTYGGVPIDAVYHSTSGPYTASAEEVWGKPVSYLASVPCPYCADSPRLRCDLTFSKSEVSSLIMADIANDPSPLVRAVASEAVLRDELTIVTRSESGRVKEARFGARSLTGNQVREALGLPSTKFGLAVRGDEVTLRVEGFGHGVGMCQYGAEAMAREGRGFRHILAYYYRGTAIGRADECLRGEKSPY